ncbi:MAG: Bax inhibitor-1 family protein [Patescibacteria group bacterium]
MFDLLFTRTFLIVGGMLLITAIVSRFNKAFETGREILITLGGTFIFLFATIFFADMFPINLFMVAIFSGLIGWQIGPVVAYYDKSSRLKKFLKDKGIYLKKGQKPTPEQIQEFEKGLVDLPNQFESQNVVFQAMMATALAVLATAGMVFFTNLNFSFLGGFLLICLIILLIMGLINVFFFRSPFFSLIRAYFGVVIFTLYLLFDFNRLEQMANDKSWGAAVDIAVNIYLDIINLFLDLLRILGDSDN